MGIIKTPPSAHPFVAIMFATPEQLQQALGHLTERLGAVWGSGLSYKVTDFTDYYVKEFGDNLQKQFFVFEKPINLEVFNQIKVLTNQLETEIDSIIPCRRVVNIDPGYLTPAKLVLFSTKNFSHRIYTGNSIFAEVTMLYAHGEFVRLPWTYSDYYWEENLNFLYTMRNKIVKIARNNLNHCQNKF
ncbi:MAG: DUF4416 family protein [Candidatus Marinimicrobia bacterium]|nr:DUF4416 family protein [Candidatus Neomarinimicrobiota bacterium]MBL7066874.1 DUF4416 family protein [Candidatus Neomarinimicrobiota bacterium]